MGKEKQKRNVFETRLGIIYIHNVPLSLSKNNIKTK